MDFIETMESDNFDIPMLDYEVINYIFFENRLNSGYGGTIESLLEHCKKNITTKTQIQDFIRKMEEIKND